MDKELTFKEALRAAKGMGENIIKIDLLLENYQEAEETICRWLDGHPRKTRKMEFLEKFPNAKLLHDGTPRACCEDFGYNEDSRNCNGMCAYCWNKAIDEDEKK